LVYPALSPTVGINLGSWSFLGMLLLILFTLVIKISYDKWKITHKFMGIFFILSIFHIFLLSDLIGKNIPLAVYLGILSFLGLCGYLYKTILLEWAIPKASYTVTQIEKLTDQVMEITLAPKQQTLTFTSGQFCFFSFQGAGLSSETHPYTICNATNQRNITVIVKALGDYTRHLYQQLKPGTTALLEGPYGKFFYNPNSNRSQVWIAGGVGIAPFISWCEEIKQKDCIETEIDLYYCVNSQKEALHLQKFNELARETPNFHIHLSCAEKDGFLKATDIPDVVHKEIFICGPKAMRQTLIPDLQKLQIRKEYIHFEDFDFF